MRKILFVASIFWITINLNAQIHSLGVLSGLNISNISAENIFNNTKNKIGFVGGIKYDVIFKNKLLIGADLLYSQQGFKDQIIFRENEADPGYLVEGKFKYNYLILPIKFGYVLGNKVQIEPKIGIQPGIILKAKTLVPAINEEFPKTTYNVTDKVTSIDLAGIVECEFCYKVVSNIGIFTLVSYKYSFTDFSNKDYYGELSNLQHRILSVSLGLKYNFIK